MEWKTERKIAEALRKQGAVEAIDLAFADFLIRLSGEKARPEHHLAFLLLSHTLHAGKHVRLDIKRVSNQSIEALFSETPLLGYELAGSFKTPLFTTWIESIGTSPVVGAAGEYKPVILSGARHLYLHRYYEYEVSVAAAIMKRLAHVSMGEQAESPKPPLNVFFPNPKTIPDWQRVAAFLAVSRSFAVISGGPGTGKTHTVAAIMAILLNENPQLKISLCAPTGKAAARLKDSILAVKAHMSGSTTLYEKIPEETSTIHRLIGVQNHPPYFKRRKGNPLQTDMVIVDEASMVSLSLLARLVYALPDHAAIILLGDKNQLASVEAGAIFGNICGLSDPPCYSERFAEAYYKETGERLTVTDINPTLSPLRDCVAELSYSYRFEKHPDIGLLSGRVLQGDRRGVFDLLEDPPSSTLAYRELSSLNGPEKGLGEIIETHFHKIVSAPSVAEAFACFESFRILCSQRKGLWGVMNINNAIETLLENRRHIDPLRRFYKGRPIIILKNDYDLGLYNGDVGLAWEDETGLDKLFFPSTGNQFRAIAPSRLPDHETVFAMTIHKSQGSEFDSVLMILPKGGDKLLSRELLYTGITRAKEKICVWADPEALDRAILTPVERWSGLADHFSYSR